MNNPVKTRINWVDQLKGFGIILVIYGHNFPFLESYIYTFHMPLFFFVGGLFHPESINLKNIKKRAKQILIPYFLWSFLLFLFWFCVGRKFGDSVTSNYSPIKNFFGIFYAQGDHEYMSWGIPMWFLPAIFLSFLIFGYVKRLKTKKYQILVLFILITIGFLIPRILKTHVLWSLDVSLVALSFYALAYYLKGFIIENKITKYQYLSLLIFSILHLLCALFLTVKVDMYRSTYINEFQFLLNAFVAIGFWVLAFKRIKEIKLLSYLGKNTIPILALHLRILTVIKLFLWLAIGTKTFNFNEIEKIILVIVQLILLYPILFFINKYLPILNGKNKVKATN